MGFLKDIGQSSLGSALLGPIGMGGGANPITSVFGGNGEMGLLGTGYRIPEFNSGYETEQTKLLEALKLQLTGQAPSLADMQTQNAIQQNLKAQQQGIQSIGGISGALKQRMIANKAAQAGTDAARQGGELRLTEQQNAQKSVAQLLSDLRSGQVNEEAARQGAFDTATNRRQGLVKAVGEGLGAAAGK